MRDAIVRKSIVFILVTLFFLSAASVTVETGSRGLIVGIPLSQSGDDVGVSSFFGGLRLDYPAPGVTVAQRDVYKNSMPEILFDSLVLHRSNGVANLSVYGEGFSSSGIRKARREGYLMILLDSRAMPSFITTLNSVPQPGALARGVIDSLSLLVRDGMFDLSVHSEGGLMLPQVTQEDGKSVLVFIGAKGDSQKMKQLKAGAFYSSLQSFVSGDTLRVVFSHSEGVPPLFMAARATSEGVSLLFSDRREHTHEMLSFCSASGEVWDGILQFSVPTQKDKPLFIVKKDDVNLRTLPSTGAESSVRNRLPLGTLLRVTARQGEWAAVLLDNNVEGWIHGSMIERQIEEAPAKELASLPPTSLAEHTYYVVRDEVNFRSAPSSDAGSRVLSQLPFGTALRGKEAKGSWLNIHLLDGTEGWIHSSMVLDSVHVTPELWERIASVLHPVSEDTPSMSKEFVETESSVSLQQKPQAQFSLRPDEEGGADSSALVASSTAKVEEPLLYKAYGRDPFLPLTVRNAARPALPKVDNVNIVGIIYSSDPTASRFALVEESIDGAATTFTLKEGDAVENGRLLRIEAEKVIFLLREADVSYTVDKKLVKLNE